MGLLDALMSGGGGGGLLDFLRNNAMNQQLAGPLQPDQAQYGAPPMMANAQMQPQQTAPQAAPVPQAAPAQQPSATPSFASSGFGRPDSIVGMLTGSPQRSQTQLFQAYVGAGFTPQQAYLAVLNPDTAKSMMGGGQTDDIKEYQFAKKENPSLTFEKFMQQKKAVSGEYSLTPQFGTDDKGNTVMIQTGKSGTAIQTVLPPGVKLSSGVDKIDLGTTWGIIDKKTGQMVGQQAKDIEGKESAEERGKAKGLAQVALPNVIANAEQTLQTIKSIKEDPYRERGTGLSSVFNAIPATGGYDFAQKLEQLKGKTFLEAFQQLKGGGAITEIEGKKAESAIARLSAGQSEGAFLEAINELEKIVTAGIERAKVRAGQGGQASQAPAAPSGGLPPGWSVKAR
jgi:hypothetical protein